MLRSVLQSEISGPSRFVSREPTYKEKLPVHYEETKSELGEVDNFVEDLIKKQIDAFTEVTENKEVPQERYEEFVENAIDSGQKFLEMKNHPDQVETYPGEFNEISTNDETQRRKNDLTSDSEVNG